jgi:prophage regulatory protein
MNNNTPSTSQSFIRMPELLKKVNLSKSTIYDKINVNSPRFDPDFPKQRKLGGRAVAWLDNEVQEWIDTRY